MTLLPLPSGLARSLALLGGASLTIVLSWGMVMPAIAASDLASVATLVCGCGLISWAAARVSLIDRLSLVHAFTAGLILPVSFAFLVSPRAKRAANDNDQDFSGSWPQFISE